MIIMHLDTFLFHSIVVQNLLISNDCDKITLETLREEY